VDNTQTFNRFNYLDNLTIMRGRHSFKTGLDFIRMQNYYGGARAMCSASTILRGVFPRPAKPATSVTLGRFSPGIPDAMQRFTPRQWISVSTRSGLCSGRLEADGSLEYECGRPLRPYGVPYDRMGLYYSFDPATGALVFPTQYAMDNVNPLFNPLIPKVLASSIATRTI